MTTKVVGLFDKEWFEHRKTEWRLWKQATNAFACKLELVHEPYQIWEMPGPKTFLMPHPKLVTTPLSEYVHPEDAIYVFGNTRESLRDQVKPEDEVVTIYTYNTAHMFGHTTAGIVLYDRMLKNVH